MRSITRKFTGLAIGLLTFIPLSLLVTAQEPARPIQVAQV
jgi:hypothetical protein